jgi:hypothetical protein
VLHFQTLELDQGCYESTLCFNSNDPDQPTLQFPVSMEVIDTTAPGSINDLVLETTDHDSILLEWTAPGDNGNSGRASHYEIWFSSTPDGTPTLETSELKMENLVPKAPGSRESILLKSTMTEAGTYFIRVHDEAGLTSCSNAVTVQVSAVKNHKKPQNLVLQNFPNPFNVFTEIRFSIAEQGRVLVDIYNARGQKVRTLLESEMEADEHQIRWDATDDYNQPVSSGYYIYSIRAPGFIVNKKMLLLK